MGVHVLGCKVLSGKNIGDVVFIPRMTLVPSNSTLPIKFQRRQFPLMLYVAFSRVKSRSGIKILIKSESGESSSSTNNVVYKEVYLQVIFFSSISGIVAFG
ncbi:PREDICTED: uncharacterized protein LOC105948932 [Erythranthe guttata]|uniref:uncharacterized protein LOC105948932 n=1 Tax=Erythranthe guttata TaxID=4155 RepID=UPI00064DF724|nr:PREDICTED: uncharacterized protein LOC105948932 [Erythranthe guttata]|eukprot:XP_012827647.1 PREDICTED: uncharacterized protein LOC105948932 [Erythranthe guttata]